MTRAVVFSLCFVAGALVGASWHRRALRGVSRWVAAHRGLEGRRRADVRRNAKGLEWRVRLTPGDGGSIDEWSTEYSYAYNQLPGELRARARAILYKEYAASPLIEGRGGIWRYEPVAIARQEIEGRFVQLCHGDRDGECHWKVCPQLSDGEPARSGRHCPLDIDEDANELGRGIAGN